MAAEGQSDRMASDVGVCMKHRCVIEFLHAEDMAPVDIHQCLLNAYGDQPVGVSTVRQRMVWVTSTCGEHRLFFVTGEDAQVVVVTTEKIAFCT